MIVTPGLFAPESYRKATADLVNEIVNGCGAGNARFDFVPDTILGLSISECCNVHDWMYSFGSNLEDKKQADRVMLNNCLRVIEKKGGWLKSWRRIRAREYYLAVKSFGGPAYWEGKEGGPVEPKVFPDEYNWAEH